jgi:hypothetical protein
VASAASVDKTLVNTCKLYNPDGSFTGASIILGLRIQATIPNAVAPGGTASITGAHATASLGGSAVKIAHGFGDAFSGTATTFGIAVTGATPALLNAAATPIPFPSHLLPALPADGSTPAGLDFNVPDSGVLPDIGPLTATGPVGSSVVATFPNTATALVTDVTFTKADGSSPVKYTLKCRPNAFIDEDETIPQDLTLGSVPIQNIVVAPAPTISSISPTHGDAAGGGQVVITGTALDAITAVKFGSSAASIVSKTATSATVTVPAGTAGTTVDVVATNATGSSATSAGDKYTYDAPTTVVPLVKTVDPNQGYTSGDDYVIITGDNLAGATKITIGGIDIPVGSFDDFGDDSLGFLTPASTVGVKDIIVTGADGTKSVPTAGDKFTYIAKPPSPTITSITPNKGPSTGGTSIVIKGTNFNNVQGVVFSAGDDDDNGAFVTEVTTVSSTEVDLKTPPHPDGVVHLVIFANDGANDPSASDAFTYGSVVVTPKPPTITTVAPTSGPLAGGTSVTITGTNLDTTTGVTVGGKPATLGTKTATSVVITTPAGTAAGSAPVVVTNPDGTASSTFTYTQPVPTITSLSPATGSTFGGETVTINGTNFVSGSTVSFGGTAGTNVVVTATKITATAPAHAAGKVDVSVTGASLTTANTAADDYTYVQPVPTITSLSPATGSTFGGETVTLTGANYVAGSTVKFGTVAATNVTVVSSTKITATAPAAAAGKVDVSVSGAGVSNANTAGDDYTYVQPVPTISGLAPASGPTTGGTSVTITGNNFVAGSTVKFGTVAATGVIVDSKTQIRATAPAAAAAGKVDVQVSGAGVSSANTATDDYTYVVPAPTVTSISPSTGDIAAGTSVTITGTNLTGASVKFGSVAATSVVVNSATSVTAKAPVVAAAGVVDVIVTTAGGSSAVVAGDKFTYTSVVVPVTPTVTSISPNAGASTGGTVVTINGSGFVAGATVKFGTLAGTGVTVVSATQIKATTPAVSITADLKVDVTVTTTGGTSAVVAGDAFTYKAPVVGALLPRITKIVPNVGLANIGGVTTISGVNFKGVKSVKFGAVSASSFFVAGNTIIAVAPKLKKGSYPVTVTTTAGSSPVSNVARYTYLGF